MKTEFSEELIRDIKDKRELRALDEDFIVQKLEAFWKDKRYEREKKLAIEKLNSSKTYKQFAKSREHDFLIKHVRAELRKVYGAFILEQYAKKDKILKRLEKAIAAHDEHSIISINTELLKLHKSTNERLGHYERLYEQIFEYADSNYKNKKYIFLDLACGLNPISTNFFINNIKKYYASDISSQDCEFIEKYFNIMKIDGDVFPMDLADEKNYGKLSKIKCDICFIFKALDGIERVERNITEKLLKAIDTKYFAITFPTLSLGGKREIKEHRRLWLEKLFDKLGLKWEKTLIDNELLYMVEK